MEKSSSCAKTSPQPDQECYDYWFDCNIMDDWLESFKDGLDQPPSQSDQTDESKLKRNSPSETNNSFDKKKLKRISDQKYRERKKATIEKTKEEVYCLQNQLNGLMEENERLKREVLDKTKTLITQEEMMGQLQKNFDQMKNQHRSQSILVRVITEKLYSANDVDLRRENTNLKKQIDHLMNLIDNPNKFEIFKLEQDKAESEKEMRVLRVIVEALCQKIYNHETHKAQQQLVL